MHEAQAIQTILDKAVKQARERNASRITGLHIVIGELSDFTEDAVAFQWEQISKATIAADAKLHFRRVPAELQCMACFTKYHPEAGNILCPNCGSVGAKVLSGEEFYLEALDVT